MCFLNFGTNKGCRWNNQTTVAEGQTIYPDPEKEPCTQCQCVQGSMVCTRQTCPVLPCPANKAGLQPGACCPVCQGNIYIYIYTNKRILSFRSAWMFSYYYSFHSIYPTSTPFSTKGYNSLIGHSSSSSSLLFVECAAGFTFQTAHYLFLLGRHKAADIKISASKIG